MKTTAALLVAAGLGLFAAFATSPRTSADGATPAVINGARNPAAIPDRVAYSLMLRLVSSPRDEEEKRRLDGYVAQIGFESQQDVNVLLAVAAEFKERSAAVDSQVSSIKEREGRGGSGRTRATREKLRELRALNDSAADNAINCLASRLSPSGLAKLRRFIDDRVKRGVRMRPSS